MSKDFGYWRSLEELEELRQGEETISSVQSPESRFPDQLNRRAMVRLMSASLGLAGLTSCRRPEETIVPYVSTPEGIIPGVARSYASAMPIGENAYGVLVQNHEGRPTKIEGNEQHPASLGAANHWVQASILDLYDPDRSRTPLARSTGGDFEAATWKDFIEAWKSSILPDIEDVSGANFAILSGSKYSPTWSGLKRQLLLRFPKAEWVVYEPFSDQQVVAGIQLATGQAARPVYALDQARVILSLDSDFLLRGGDTLRLARGFSRSRQLREEAAEMSRLYVMESSPSVTGAAADHRMVVHPGDHPALLLALALELERLGLKIELGGSVTIPDLPFEIGAQLALIAADLMSAGPNSAIIPSRNQPPEVHALSFGILRALGAEGSTVSLRPSKWTESGSSTGLSQLVTRMRRNEISTLIMLEGNPVYTAPADLRFRDALSGLPHSVHLSDRQDETSKLVQWHLPLSHYLESWGDNQSLDGSLNVGQPLIAPLFQSRSSLELLSVLVRNQETPGYQLVRETWLELLGEDDFESRWERVLHDGVHLPEEDEPEPLPLTGVAEAVAMLGQKLDAKNPEGEREEVGLLVSFALSESLHDGRFANNAWLQELPSPVTKLTWGNAALVSPQTALGLGLESGDLVRLNNRGLEVEGPVLVLAGQADGVLTLPVGYGRTCAGGVGNDVGFDAYRIRRSDQPFWATGVLIERIGPGPKLAQTQEHWQMEGRDLVRQTDLSVLSEVNETEEHHPEHAPLWEEHPYTESPQWGMAIDLNSCTGCNACIVACQSENNIPVVGKEQVIQSREMHWLRVDRYFSGEPSSPEILFQPLPCMHCENAPCEQVCPVSATVHDSEGLNAMVYNRCIGTRYCSNNCPYKVRRFNFFNYTRDLPELLQMAANPDVTVRSRGVMEKCTYCVQRVNEAKIQVSAEGRPLADGDVRTACQQTCPAEAIVFGDITDPDSQVSRLKKLNRNYVLLESLHHKPRTSYLTRVKNRNPSWRES